MTDLTAQIEKALEGATPGPWTGHNMVHADGSTMTADELGEYVANSVRMSGETRFLFVSGAHPDGGTVDVCHTGNGPRGPHNTALIALAPQMAEAYLSMAARLEKAEAIDDERLDAAVWAFLGYGASHTQTKATYPDLDWKVSRDWTLSVVREQMRKALSAYRGEA